MTQEILLGDEAVARGAIDAGISAAYAYPGTPSTEIFQTVQDHAKRENLPIRGLWSTNEKVALEEGVGVSYCGKRALVAMKHVGLNVAADPFMNVAIAGAHGGLVIAVADDPSMHSSQNEQDSRHYADFAQIPCLEPADQQQCYDFTREAFDLSERLQVPVLLRLVTRLAHSRAGVTLAPARAQNPAHYVADHGRYTLIPSNARRAYAGLLAKQPAFVEHAEAHPANALALRGDRRPGILASGVAWNYLREALGPALDAYNVLRIGAYPLPVAKVRRLLDASSEVFVVEEGYPFIERYVSALGLLREPPIRGKLTGHLPRSGELTPDALKAAFGIAVSPSLQLPGLDAVLFAAPRVIAVDAVRAAHRAGTVKAQNMVMLGAAARLLPVPASLLEEQLRALFADKGRRIVDANVAAFRMGDAASRFGAALVAGGVAPAVVARAVAGLELGPEPVADDVVAAWVGRLRGPGGEAAAMRAFAARGAA